MNTSRSASILVRALIVLVAILGLIGLSYNRIARLLHSAPLIVVDRASLELGSGKVGEVKRGTFKISNAGGTPLDFQTEVTCACTEVSQKAGRIGPKESIILRVGVSLSEEGSRTARLSITSNDPDKPRLDLVVHAHCPMALNVVPRSVDFGDVTYGTSQQFSIFITHPDPAIKLRPDQISLKTASPHISTSIEQNEPGEMKVVLRLGKESPLGLFHEDAVLSLQGEDRTLSVPITANVVTIIGTSPKSLILRRAESSPDGSTKGPCLSGWETESHWELPAGSIAHQTAPLRT